MSKRPNTMETVKLALELMQRIPPRAKITAEELHVQLNAAGLKRELRTIQRQLKALCQHFDIECLDQDKPYGYRWKEKAKGMSLPSMGPRESLLLALAQEQMRALLPTTLAKSMDGMFQQAQRNLGPTSSAHKEREWLKKVRVVSTTQPLLPPKIPEGVFEAVSDALFKNLWLKIDYANSSGGRTKGSVMPLGLAQQGPRLYLACRFEGFDNNRILALHRIKSAELSTMPFDRPKDFDLGQYAEDGQFGFGDGKRVRLEFRITQEAGMHLLESPLSQDQTAELIGRHYRITATVVDSMLLDRWVRGFGDDINAVRKVKSQN